MYLNIILHKCKNAIKIINRITYLKRNELFIFGLWTAPCMFRWQVQYRIVNNLNENMEEGLELLEPTELYNMLQQATIFSNLTDPNYLLLMGK